MDEWVKLSGNVPSLSLVSLGTFHNSKYHASNECLDCLNEINAKLNDKGPHTYPLRRALIFMDIFNKDLIPILIHVNQPNIIRSTIKLLVQMTLPVGCLVSGESIVQQPNETSMSKHFVHELTNFLYVAKETFVLNPLATRSIFEHLNCLLANVPQQAMSKDDCESVSYFLLLIRNIVHAPEGVCANQSASVGDSVTYFAAAASPGHWQQRRLLSDLLTQGLDLLLIDLLTCSQKDEWIVTIAQLITLIFKDHTPEKIQKLVSSEQMHRETPLPSSSDVDTDSGNCSQTSSCNSATETANKMNKTSGKFYWTRKPTTTGTFRSKKKHLMATMRTADKEEIPDFQSGYQRRKKILTSRRSRAIARHIQTKSKIPNYTPSEDEISQLLKEFTVNFLPNGYNALVSQLYQRLLEQGALPMFDKSYFLWLISYFLPIASHLELNIFKHLKDVVCVDIISYLIWESASESEEFEINSLNSADLQPGLRRMQLGVKAIRECLLALEARSSYVGKADGSYCQEQMNIFKFRASLAKANDLRQLPLLQLRQFDPAIQNKKYLGDVITTNHVLFKTLERAAGQPSTYNCNLDFGGHFEQFCSKVILNRYGLALNDFRTNDPFLNDCVFTLLRHVGVYRGRADLLCDPAILRPLGKIWEEGFNICQEWNDLIELIVNKFMRHYEANGCQAMESPERVVTSSEKAETPQAKPGNIYNNPASSLQPRSKIESLRDQLIKSGFQKQLDWIQSYLLTSCSARLGTYAGQEFRHAIICLSLKMNVPCPIVPWTELENSALRSQQFLHLLHRVGLFPDSYQPSIYPRIPRHWSADVLYSVALIFGPVHQQRIDFDLSRVRQIKLNISDSAVDLQSNGQMMFNNPASNQSDEPVTGENSSMSRADSLEVEKHDSSEDDEMECSDSSSSRKLTISPRNSSELRVPLDWSVHPDMGRQLSGDGDVTFQMGSIGYEISRVSYNNIRP